MTDTINLDFKKARIEEWFMVEVGPATVTTVTERHIFNNRSAAESLQITIQSRRMSRERAIMSSFLVITEDGHVGYRVFGQALCLGKEAFPKPLQR